jgi:hypothetical protein
MKSTVFWVVMPSISDTARSSEGTYRFHRQGRILSKVRNYLNLKRAPAGLLLIVEYLINYSAVMSWKVHRKICFYTFLSNFNPVHSLQPISFIFISVSSVYKDLIRGLLTWDYQIRRSSGKNYSPTFLWCDTTSIENEKNRGGYTDRRADNQTHRQQGDFIDLILFFQNKESRLKTVYLYLLSSIHTTFPTHLIIMVYSPYQFHVKGKPSGVNHYMIFSILSYFIPPYENVLPMSLFEKGDHFSDIQLSDVFSSRLSAQIERFRNVNIPLVSQDVLCKLRNLIVTAYSLPWNIDGPEFWARLWKLLLKELHSISMYR